jgi:transposase-like protein
MMTVNELMLKIQEAFSIETLSSEDVCRDWFLQELHPAGAVCPECNVEIASNRKLESYRLLKRVTCSACNRTFTGLTGTVLNGLGLDFRALYLFLFMISCGVSANKFYRQLGISSGAAYIWQNKAKSAGRGELQQTAADGEP